MFFPQCVSSLQHLFPLYRDFIETIVGKSTLLELIVLCLLCDLIDSLQIKKYEKLDSEEDRAIKSRQIFDVYIMKELLSCSHVSGPKYILP